MMWDVRRDPRVPARSISKEICPPMLFRFVPLFIPLFFDLFPAYFRDNLSPLWEPRSPFFPSFFMHGTLTPRRSAAPDSSHTRA